MISVADDRASADTDYRRSRGRFDLPAHGRQAPTADALSRPETDDARSIGAAYQTTPAKLQHCRIELAWKIKKNQFNLRPLTKKAVTVPALWAELLAAQNRENYFASKTYIYRELHQNQQKHVVNRNSRIVGRFIDS